ncbi:MAG TPA: alpha/beta hydrolase [Mycobacterium sp.]|nr:alpha/beta hydrolase [Mycobacterium sp.]
MLEVIDKGGFSATHPVPLLFVHGGLHAAWCWDEHFLKFFAGEGYRAVAVSLRGHGSSQTPKALRRCSIADYVDDVFSVADSLPVTPVVIGHSMGGFVVQKYLEVHEAPAAVLLASAPARGVLGIALRFAKRHAWRSMKGVVTGESAPAMDTAAVLRETFFCAQTPKPVVAQCVERFQGESVRAVFDMLLLNLPRPKQVTVPVLVLGAESDGFLTSADVHATARAYQTQAEFFPDMGHDMMLEPGWKPVAARIHSWLGGQGL